MWNEIGSRPDNNEIEITILGPGFGESILVHIGSGQWIILDSCIDLSDDAIRTPAPLLYLRHLGVSVENDVRIIIATHWDSDHIKGLADLVDACKSAQFCCANALLRGEFLKYSERLMTGSAATNGAQISEFKRALDISVKRVIPIKWLGAGRELKVWPADSLSHGRSCTLRSLSPSDQEFTLFLEEVASEIPQRFEGKRAAAARTPNLASIVIHIDWGETAVLLGADMEIHSDIRRGWAAAINDAKERNLSKADVFKVSHHGSKNGHHDSVWTDLLIPSPLCMLTPFSRGSANSRPPTQEDVERINKLAPESYITTRRTVGVATKYNVAIENGLRESNIKLTNKRRPLGVVRFRKNLTGGTWQKELFGPACHIEDH